MTDKTDTDRTGKAEGEMQFKIGKAGRSYMTKMLAIMKFIVLLASPLS